MIYLSLLQRGAQCTVISAVTAISGATPTGLAIFTNTATRRSRPPVATTAGASAASASAGGLGMGPESFRGRKMGSVDLRLVLLMLLAERPSHGYELIKALEERSGGFYSPSPGMVYPALTWLEEVGYASVTAEGAKKLYHITAEGQAYLAQNKASRRGDPCAAGADRQAPGPRARGRRRLRGRGGRGLQGSLAGAARTQGVAARRPRQLPAEEASRIAQILKDAAAKIRGGR